MYEYISGTISKVTPKYIVVDNRGIGYQIFVPNPYQFKKQDIMTVYTYFHIREDSQELYGFLTEDERDMFIKLIGVTGIGPKSALPILAAASVNEILLAISNGDTKYIQKFPGIGPKAASQIILDLRGKIDFDKQEMPNLLYDEKMRDCEEALIALGYNKKEVAKVLGKVDSTLEPSLIIKSALKLLSKI